MKFEPFLGLFVRGSRADCIRLGVRLLMYKVIAVQEKDGIITLHLKNRYEEKTIKFHDSQAYPNIDKSVPQGSRSGMYLNRSNSPQIAS